MREYYHQSSDRLNFNPLRADHIPIWSTFFIENPSARFVGSDQFSHFSPTEKAANWINRQIEYMKSDRFGQLAVSLKSTKEFIGVAGIIVREINGQTEYEVTYSLLPTHWNQGYATEMAVHIKEWMFVNYQVESVISIIHQENAASIRVAEKNGMIGENYFEFMNMPVKLFRCIKSQR